MFFLLCYMYINYANNYDFTVESFPKLSLLLFLTGGHAAAGHAGAPHATSHATPHGAPHGAPHVAPHGVPHAAPHVGQSQSHLGQPHPPAQSHAPPAQQPTAQNHMPHPSQMGYGQNPHQPMQAMQLTQQVVPQVIINYCSKIKCRCRV